MSRPKRVRMAHIERLLTTLSSRDWAIISSLDRVRLASGLQLERLHFYDLSTRSRSVKRWQVLKRLVDARVLLPFERRIGTSTYGSDKLRYTLDSAGRRLMQLRANAEGLTTVRRPKIPGERFVAHALTVSELYVSLVELSRLGGFVLEEFQTEPRWPSGVGGVLGPDAYVRVNRNGERYSWWYEADLATESLPTMRAKLLAYLDFVQRGQLGPLGVVPWVLIGVPTEARRMAVQRIVNGLPEPASYLFRISLLPEVIGAMIKEFLA